MGIIKLRRDTAANFAASNRILAQGEPALEIDTLKEKIGDGFTAWNSLPYRFTSGGGTSMTNAQVKTAYEANANTNAFTDAEKTKLAQQSGTNTGDQDLSGLQSKLVSGTSIKTVNGTSLLGSGNIVISGGSGGSGASIDKGAFSGILDLSNIHCNRYNEYNLSSGSINFSIQAGSVPFGYAYVRVVSNGATPLLSSENMITYFRERNGMPENRVLPLGTWNVYIWKLPLGDDLAIGISEYKGFEDGSEGSEGLPFFEDAVFYFNRSEDEPILDGNGVREVVNRVDPLNNLKNITSTRKPLDNPTNLTVDFYRTTSGGTAAQDSRITCNEITFNRGACTVVYAMDFGSMDRITSGDRIQMHGNVTGNKCYISVTQNGTKNNVLDSGGFGFNVNPTNFFGHGYDNIFYGKMLVAITSDSVSGTLRADVRSTHFSESQSKTTTVGTPDSFTINGIFIAIGNNDIGVNSISLYNKICTVTEVNEIFDYLESKYPL